MDEYEQKLLNMSEEEMNQIANGDADDNSEDISLRPRG